MVRFALHSAEGWINSGANRDNGAIAIGLAASCPIPPAGDGARTDSHLFFRWRDAVAEISDAPSRRSPLGPQTRIHRLGPGTVRFGQGRARPLGAGEGRDDGLARHPRRWPPASPALSATVPGSRSTGIFRATSPGSTSPFSGWTGSPPMDLAGKVQALVSVGPGSGARAESRGDDRDRGPRPLGLGPGAATRRGIGRPRGEGDAGSRRDRLRQRSTSRTRYATITASGRLDRPWTARIADFRGTARA